MEKTLKKIEQPNTRELEVQAGGMNLEMLIAKAIDKGASVETMEKFLAMRRELKAEWAKEQFDNDMSSFQGECPVIEKRKEGGKTNSGQVAYKYAPLDSIVSQVKEIIKKYGFSYAIKIEINSEKKLVKAICIVKHRAGHSESSELEVPLGTKTQVMSDSQVVAAASTFAKRYAFCNAFGIMTGDDDNEKALKSITVEEIDIVEYQIMMEGVDDLDSLKKMWLSFPPKAQTNRVLLGLKNALKQKFAKSNATIQE